LNEIPKLKFAARDCAEVMPIGDTEGHWIKMEKNISYVVNGNICGDVTPEGDNKFESTPFEGNRILSSKMFTSEAAAKAYVEKTCKPSGRAGGITRTSDVQPVGDEFHVVAKGGSIGHADPRVTSTHATREEAAEKAKRMNKLLSPGEKKYYGLGYGVKEVK
jgi:hypothetical protein